MRVLVTGGAGQLGTLVLRRLVDDPRVERVCCLDLRPPALSADKLTSVRADVRDASLARHLEGCDALVHLASVGLRSAPAHAYSVNVEGSRNVFRAAAAAGVRRWLYASSIAAYGVVAGHPLPLTEEAPRRRQADFPYAATQWEVEEALDALERAHPAAEVVRLRPALLVGRHMEHALGRAWGARLMVVASSLPLPVVWDEDVADAVLLALCTAGARGAFNLAAEMPLPAELAASLGGMWPLRVPREVLWGAAQLSRPLTRLGLGEGVEPSWVRFLDAPLVVSSEKAREVLGWRPRCPSAAHVWRHFDRVVPHQTDRRILLFVQLLKLAGRRTSAPDLGGIHSRVHLALTGRSGGDFGLEVREGRLRVLPAPPRPPTATLTLPARLFLDLLSGRTDPAAAQRTGRIRLEGEGHAGRLLSGMVTTWRALTAPERGLTARLLSRLMGQRAAR